MGVWERGVEPNILMCVEMLGVFPGLVPRGTTAPLFYAGIARLAPPHMTHFHGLLSQGLGKKSPDGEAIKESVV